MNTSILKQLGFTDNELKIYLVLAGLGASTVSPIARQTGLQRSVVYFCLNQLIAKGFISFFIKNNKKHFQISGVSALTNLIELKKQALDRQKAEITKLIPLLLEQKFGGNEPLFKVFEGWLGVQEGFLSVINSLPINSEAITFTLSKEFGKANPDLVRKVINEIKKAREKQKIMSRIIVSNDAIASIGFDEAKSSFSDVRALQELAVNPAVFNVFGNEFILIVVAFEKPILLVIKSKEIAFSFKQHFEFLWNTAKSLKNSKQKIKLNEQ